MTRKQESRQEKEDKKIQNIFLAARKSPPGRPKSPQSPSFPGKTQTAPDITHRLILRHTADLSHPCTGPSNSQRFSYYSCLSAGPHSPKRLSSASAVVARACEGGSVDGRARRVRFGL